MHSPDEVFAAQLRSLRERQPWTQAELATRMTELGFPIDQATIARLERNRGARGPSLSQVIGAAIALGVAPVYLVTPWNEESISLSSQHSVPTQEARAWFRGERALDGDSKRFWTQMPDDDFELHRNEAFHSVHVLRNLLLTWLSGRSEDWEPALRDSISERLDEVRKRVGQLIREGESGSHRKAR